MVFPTAATGFSKTFLPQLFKPPKIVNYPLQLEDIFVTVHGNSINCSVLKI